MYLLSLTFKDVVNEIILPLKLIIPQPIIKHIPGLTTNEDIRINNVLKCVPPEANCLDIGCGSNLLIKKHRLRGGKGIGVDIYGWEGVDLLVEDSSKLPFEDKTFDCITCVAALSHIPNRIDVLHECNRLLRDKGIIICTNPHPYFSIIWHKWAFWDKDQHQRGMKEGELYALTDKEMRRIFGIAGFKGFKKHIFSWGLNNLYIFKK
ncbi:class I SAM-dependent methyltransferase [Candidatus Omnitrophota bacterium]